MKMILLGAPGAGKGTQAQFIANTLHIPVIATGDMLRQAVKAGTTLGQAVGAYLGSGQLVPDDLVIDLVKARLALPDCQAGYLLDGFPRTVAQAEALGDAGVSLDLVMNLMVPDAEIIERLSGRYIHPASGRIYHLQHCPPKIPGLDDLTQEPLIQRNDDKKDTILRRLAIYHESTEPLIAYYQEQAKQGQLRFETVQGVGALEAVRGRILKLIQTTA